MKKWSLMSSIIVPLVRDRYLLLDKMWSIREELPFCIRVALKLFRRNPVLVKVVM